MSAISVTAGRAGLAFGLERNPDGFRAALAITVNRRGSSRATAEELAAIEAPAPITAAPRPTYGLGRYIDLFV
jgi:hypothetical protein